MMKYGVIVTGVPASGKTTIARQLASDLGFELLDKDDFLEDLFEQFGVQSLKDRKRFSRQSDQTFQDEAARSGSAVLVSHWRPLLSTDESGTPTNWLTDEYDQLVEVFCTCSPKLALARFLARTRHPGHMDYQNEVSELEKRMKSWADRFPLGIGEVLKVDAEGVPDIADLSTRIRTAFYR